MKVTIVSHEVPWIIPIYACLSCSIRVYAWVLFPALETEVGYGKMRKKFNWKYNLHDHDHVSTWNLPALSCILSHLAADSIETPLSSTIISSRVDVTSAGIFVDDPAK